ncbi:MAG: class I tRNA ligase family protein, partial [Acidobacteriota bacterium]
ELVRLTHPFMPFITEEIWQKLPHKGPSIAAAEYPAYKPDAHDEEAEQKLGALMELVTKVRNIRAEMNIPPSRLIDLYLGIKDNLIREFIEEYKVHIINLARVKSLHIAPLLPPLERCARGVVPYVEIAIPLAGLIDFEVERQRLQKEIARINEDLVVLCTKLNRKEFLTKAPPQVVADNKERYRSLEERLAKMTDSLRVLSNPEKEG